MRRFKYHQSDLDHVRWLLKTALGPLVSPKYDYDDDGIEAIIDQAAEAGCSIEEAVTAEAKAVILVTAYMVDGSEPPQAAAGSGRATFAPPSCVVFVRWPSGRRQVERFQTWDNALQDLLAALQEAPQLPRLLPPPPPEGKRTQAW